MQKQPLPDKISCNTAITPFSGNNLPKMCQVSHQDKSGQAYCNTETRPGYCLKTVTVSKEDVRGNMSYREHFSIEYPAAMREPRSLTRISGAQDK